MYIYIYTHVLYIIYILVWTANHVANLSPREFYCFFASQLFFCCRGLQRFRRYAARDEQFGFPQSRRAAPRLRAGDRWWLICGERWNMAFFFDVDMAILWLFGWWCFICRRYAIYIYIYIYIFQCFGYLMVISYLSPTNFSWKMREPRCSFRTPFLGLFSMFRGMC